MFAAIIHARITRRLALGAAALAVAAQIAGCHAQQTMQSYNPPPPAEDEFDKSANTPPNADTLYRMSRILAAQHKDDQCQAVLRNCIERYPNYMPAYAGLAQVQVRQRKLAAAMSTLKDGLALQPKDSVLLNDLGMCYMLSGDYESALAQFTAAHEASPDDARYTANMALATGMLGRYEHALTLYQTIAKPGKAHYNVAVVAEARNDMQKANEEYAAALALDPWCQRKSRSSDK